jgi:hypothetical protein
MVLERPLLTTSSLWHFALSTTGGRPSAHFSSAIFGGDGDFLRRGGGFRRQPGGSFRRYASQYQKFGLLFIHYFINNACIIE